MKCTNCGNEINPSKQFCSNCGKQIRRFNPETKEIENHPLVPGEKSKNEKWPNKIASILAFWGILNLLFASPLFGGVLILFSILIFASQSYKAIYAFGIIWLILALIQLITGALLLNSNYVYETNEGLLYVLFSFINFGFGGYTIYETRKLESI